jgi:membrane protein DedA with SNARE-associated domain
MLQHLGSSHDWPWIYAIVAASILLDVFLPVLPSGVLVISAATAGTTSAGGSLLDVCLLMLCAATASVVGDLAAYRLAWRGGAWLDNHMANSRRLSAAQEKLGAVLASRGGGGLVVLARFAPAGRSVVSLGAGAARRRPKEFLPWSALAGLTWAAYSVGLGWLGGAWLGAGWLGTVLSVAALVGSGAVAAYLFRRAPVPGAADNAVPAAVPVSVEIPVADLPPVELPAGTPVLPAALSIPAQVPPAQAASAQADLL